MAWKKTTIKTRQHLTLLIKACERGAHEFEGKDAYDFSPLSIAYFFTSCGGREICRRRIEADLENLLITVSNIRPDKTEYIGHLDVMKDGVSKSYIENVVQEIRENLQVAQAIIDLSEETRFRNDR